MSHVLSEALLSRLLMPFFAALHESETGTNRPFLRSARSVSYRWYF